MNFLTVLKYNQEKKAKNLGGKKSKQEFFSLPLTHFREQTYLVGLRVKN